MVFSSIAPANSCPVFSFRSAIILFISTAREGKTFGERSALHLLSRASQFPDNAIVLDLGCCGSGEVTRILAEELKPQGVKIIGFDVNEEAIQQAHKRYPKTLYPNLDFIMGDANALTMKNAFDVIISISLFHLVEDPKRVAYSSFQALKNGGKAIIQMPISFPLALEKATEEMIAKENWRKYFHGFSRGWNGVSEQEFAQLFQSEGFKIIRQERFVDSETLESVEKFKAFLGSWYPYLKVIPEADKQAFLEETVSAYLKLQPPSEDGKVPLIVERLEFELEKSSSL